MSGIESGFLILSSKWWSDIGASDCTRYTLFKILYSCIYHTSHSLFIYYSVFPQLNECCHDITRISSGPSDIDDGIIQPHFVKLTHKHINGIVKAYEIALDVIEMLNKIPTFDIRFIPVKNDCLSHIYRTMKSNTQHLFWPNSYKFCGKHGNLIQSATIINDLFSCICRESVYYIDLISENVEIDSIICRKYTTDLMSHGFKTYRVSDNLPFPFWENRVNNAIEADDDQFFDSPINRALFAGTFDRLHPGHKVNITVATWYAKELVIIGITDTPLNANKSDKDIIQDFSFRSANVHSFIFSLSPDISVAILRISSIVGGADIFEFDALIATPESYNNALKINDLRLACGSPLVKLVKVPFVYRPQLNDQIKGLKAANCLPVKFCSTELRFSLKQNLNNPCYLSILRNSVTGILNSILKSDCTPNNISAIMDMVFSCIDDIIFEILHEWQKLLGAEYGRVIFEEWFESFILELGIDGIFSNPKATGDLSVHVSKCFTFILIYIISSLNLIKKERTAVLFCYLNKLYLLFKQLLNDVYNEMEKGCEDSEFCIPYICCNSDIEKNIFFSKINKFKYSNFEYKFEDLKEDKALYFGLKHKYNSNNMETK
ncbi:cytidylyltransferase exon-1 [Cryptosporidium canis]|uniref:Cytidylyltransferase exon-1 n=1 Tax=Cryptosporidium canis TaxID=195482 RepID=A0A9D5HV39_9CRYT|nr:cytidylyltransferase exon-1 [Cryptosporidium canis]